MIKKILSATFIVIGVLLVGTSAYLFFNNNQAEELAETSSQNVLIQFEEEIENYISETETVIPSYYVSSSEQSEVLIDDNLYVAILTIPSLNLELPIQSSWSYEKLSLSPCFYQTEPMSIAGHNYQAHFGNLYKLEVGDTASLTYISGAIQEYQVVSVTIIHESDVDELDNSDYDLSLFTCNYNNNSERVLVRLNKITSK